MSDELVRAPIVRVADGRDETIVIGAAGTARRYSGDSAELVRAVLDICTRPVTRAELFAALEARAGGPVPAEPIEQLLALLEEDRIVTRAQALPRPPAQTRRVVLGITGAVAAVDAPSIVRGLHGIGCEVRIALSKSARQFVAPAALDALTHHAVWTGIWQRDARTPVPHVNLAEWAELVVVCPASATTIGRIAAGDCSDLVAAIATATRAPVVVVPSMNDAMYASPAVQRNLDTLRGDGRWVVHPALGFEVAHAPADRRWMLGPAPPPSAVIDIVRVLLAQHVPALPHDAAAWERLWSSADTLPWQVEHLDPPLADALAAAATRAPSSRLVDLGTGDGVVAIDAARRGFRVTAIDVAPTALARARDRAGDLPIVFVLDDVTASHLDARFDVAVDRGLLHCLGRDTWPAYARAVTDMVVPGGVLLVVAHQPGSELATTAITGDELRTLLPAFELARELPTSIASSGASLFELARR
jgi:3-polyprenyl-4-hydroxybenzoate decarboxylase